MNTILLIVATLFPRLAHASLTESDGKSGDTLSGTYKAVFTMLKTTFTQSIKGLQDTLTTAYRNFDLVKVLSITFQKLKYLFSQENYSNIRNSALVKEKGVELLIVFFAVFGIFFYMSMNSIDVCSVLQLQMLFNIFRLFELSLFILEWENAILVSLLHTIVFIDLMVIATLLVYWRYSLDSRKCNKQWKKTTLWVVYFGALIGLSVFMLNVALILEFSNYLVPLLNIAVMIFLTGNWFARTVKNRSANEPNLLLNMNGSLNSILPKGNCLIFQPNSIPRNIIMGGSESTSKWVVEHPSRPLPLFIHRHIRIFRKASFELPASNN